MFTTNVFDYTNILDKAADASWMRENVITNNIANIDTPGYKRQDVDFESVLQKALGKTKYSSLDKKVRELNQDLGKLTTTSYTDAANYSITLEPSAFSKNYLLSPLSKADISVIQKPAPHFLCFHPHYCGQVDKNNLPHLYKMSL